ncbi:MAG: hypothetical protein DLM72_07680 [Candidatus Nitrosopolaris wilkensis]|nr:MAG: hypothetical protein DLM72_07680 [Candidatus Nitrosopolaris wilkensis]
MSGWVRIRCFRGHLLEVHLAGLKRPIPGLIRESIRLVDVNLSIPKNQWEAALLFDNHTLSPNQLYHYFLILAELDVTNQIRAGCQ